MSGHSPSNRVSDGGKGRDERLANLSGAMAVARLAHQVQELELQKRKQDNLEKPSFVSFTCIIDTTILLDSLESVKRWTKDGGVSAIIPLTVLDELDKSKKGSEPVNLKTREAIRYLERRTKATKGKVAPETPSGSLRIQTPDEIFPQWEDCIKLAVAEKLETISKDEIPRHFRAMINCALFQRAQGNHFSIVTQSDDLVSIAKAWEISTLTSKDLEEASKKAVDKYQQEMKAFETRQRSAARSSSHTQRALWTPPK